MHRLRLIPAWLALAGLVIAVPIAPARADGRVAEPDGWANVLKYIGCALSVARSTDGLGLSASFATCAKLIQEEASRGVL